jgi:hypothetical protein
MLQTECDDMPYQIARFLPNKSLDPWIEQLGKRDYLSRRIIISRRIKPRFSRFLYKYRSLQGQFALENLRDILVGSVLRLSRPEDFNDPFDMTGRVVLKTTTKQKQRRFEELVRTQSPERGWRAQQAAIEKLVTASDEQLMPMVERSFAGVRQTAGIACFAGSAKSTLMWSHYAAHHTGVCLQFDRARDFATFGHALSVKYSNYLPEIRWITGAQKGIVSTLFRKHPCWKYEEESRIVVPNQAGLYLPFLPAALRSIIFGLRSDENLVATIETLLAERTAAGFPSVNIYFASRHATKYRLVIKRR